MRLLGMGSTPENGPAYGSAVELEVRCSGCGEFHVIGHDDPEVDVAVVPIASQLNTGNIFYRALGPDQTFPKDQESEGLKARTFESVLFVGYPAGLYDDHNILPIARFGHLATQLDLDYKGESAFLIDAAVFGGSSGSPVFAYRRFQKNSGSSISFGDRPHLVGVLAAVHQREADFPVLPTALAAKVSKELGLGLVLKIELVRKVAAKAKVHLGIE